MISKARKSLDTCRFRHTLTRSRGRGGEYHAAGNSQLDSPLTEMLSLSQYTQPLEELEGNQRALGLGAGEGEVKQVGLRLENLETSVLERTGHGTSQIVNSRSSVITPTEPLRSSKVGPTAPSNTKHTALPAVVCCRAPLGP